MSDHDFSLDLEKLFQPAWAQGSIEQDLLKKFAGRDDRPERPPRDGERHGQRPRGADRERHGDRRGGRGPQGDRRRDGGRGRDRDRAQRHGQRPEPREEPAPLPDVAVELQPAAPSVEHIARQIIQTSRAYPLFNIAQLMLDQPGGYTVRLTAKKSHQSLFLCALDDTPWARENEAVLHVLRNHLATFYQVERVPVEPPKGVYTFVAQLGDVLLGPPNYHDYQTKLHALHAERSPQTPFELFKSRVKITKDEALLNQWREEQSFKTEYVCLNVPEPLRLTTFDEVNRHFRETHKEHIIKRADTVTVSGPASRRLPCPGLQRLIRRDWEQLRRHPLPFATKLSQQLAKHNLQFFKADKVITHVNVARPKYLDLAAAPVSDGIRRVVEYLRATKKSNRRKLLAALAVPAPVPAVVDPLAAVGEVSATLEAPAPSPSAPPTPAELEQAQQVILADLHWLVHQGYVIEYATGRLESAGKQL
ncbi:MAG: hypothetical protein LBK60_07330 [Verrucomicrobiales bacterium]|jgi:hypothetical protein|nr:hypothetical protein [Verrucomicrobiales bacterium]